MEPATDPVSESAESNAEKDHRNNPFIIRSDTLKKQKDIYGWSLWDERVFIEKLYNQRFNYLLVVYGLLLNILYQVNGMLTTILLGLFGTVLLFVLWVMMNRVYCKLDICLKYLHNIKPDEDQADVLSPLEMSDTDEKQNSGNEPPTMVRNIISAAFGKKKVLHYQKNLSLMCIFSWIILAIVKASRLL